MARASDLAARRTIAVRDPAATIDVVASKSHRTPETDTYIARYPVGDLVSAGSSLKFCLVAEGRADLYPRMGTTMQWDTAAGDAVLRAAATQLAGAAPEPSFDTTISTAVTRMICTTDTAAIVGSISLTMLSNIFLGLSLIHISEPTRPY